MYKLAVSICLIIISLCAAIELNYSVNKSELITMYILGAATTACICYIILEPVSEELQWQR